MSCSNRICSGYIVFYVVGILLYVKLISVIIIIIYDSGLGKDNRPRGGQARGRVESQLF